MKRIILFISMLMFLSFGVTAQTLSTDTFSTANSNLPTVGSNFEVPIDVTDIGTMYSLTIYFEYDPEIVSYTGYTNGQVSGITITDQTSSILKILVADFPNQTTISDGKLLDLQFDYYGGDSDFKFHTSDYGTYQSSVFYGGSTFNFADSDVTNGGVYSGYVENTITDGPWATATNWSLGVVPNTYHNVTVSVPVARGEVTIEEDAVAHDVTIADGGWLTINSTFTLDAGGDFTIESGGSFIEYGTLNVTGTASAEREIEGADWSTQLDGWHLLSSPVASQNIAPNFTGGDYDFYRWDEPTLTWQNYKAGHTGFTSFVVGKGYLVAYNETGTKVFSGDFNKNDVSKSGLTHTGMGTDDGSGWNLLGNPFPSAINWGTASWGLSNVQGTAKVWNVATSGYVDITSGNVIPALNGFMVYVDAATGSLTIPASEKAHSTQAWYKSQDQQIFLIAHDLDYEGLQQNSIIRFKAEATAEYDLEYDSYFLGGYAPMLYSVAEGDAYLSLNTLPEWNKDLVVPFMFQKNQSSNFMIELAETIESADVILRDNKTNTVINLSETGTYTFTSEEDDDPARFEIMFGYVGINDPAALETAHVFSNGNTITVANVNGETQMSIINLQGQEIEQHEFNSSGYTTVNVELPTGVYFVRLLNNGEAKTSKVYIK